MGFMAGPHTGGPGWSGCHRFVARQLLPDSRLRGDDERLARIGTEVTELRGIRGM